MRRQDKPLYVEHGEIKTPPMSGQARIAVGYHLRLVQQGELLSMPLSRPMPRVGANCHELRIGDTQMNTEWRVMYFIDDIAIVVLEVWKKDTRQTPQWVIDVCQDRLKRYLNAKTRG